MKQLKYFRTPIYTLIGAGFVLLSACKNKSTDTQYLINSNDLKAIQQKRASLLQEVKNIEKQVAILDSVINQNAPEGKSTLVSVIQVKDTVFQHFVEIQANVKTDQNIFLNAEINGILDEILVKEGQFVQKGQVLARIQDGGLSQQLSQMEAEEKLAKTTFERQEKLWSEKIGSEIQYLQAKTNYQARKNAVEQLKKQVAKSIITAPFSGYIDHIETDLGSFVSAGTKIFRIVNLSQMYIEAEIPETYIHSIGKGAVAIVQIPVLGRTINTTVNQSSQVIDPKNRSFRIDILLENNDQSIKPNMSALIQVEDYINKKAMLLPTDIISENAEGQEYIFIAQPQSNGSYIAKKQLVVTGFNANGKTEIRSGLTPDMLVIKDGGRSVHQGQQISIYN